MYDHAFIFFAMYTRADDPHTERFRADGRQLSPIMN